MNTENVLILLNFYRQKGVQAVRTPSGIVFMGMLCIPPLERQRLNSVSQSALDAALRIQNA